MRLNEKLRLGFKAIIISIIFSLSFACGTDGGGGGDGQGEAAPTTYSISGQVMSGGTGLSGVTVTLSGTSFGTTTTDNNGNYSFTNLSNGSYTVTPSLTDYSFDPVYRNVNISGSNRTGIDFTAIPDTYSISGQVTNDGNGLNNVTLSLSGDSSGTTSTDSNGDYSFTGLSNGSYKVTPSKTGHGFNPAYRNVNISGASETAVDFVAESIQLEQPNTKNVYGEISLPDQSPIDLSSLKIQSFLTNVNVGSSGYFSNLQVTDEGGGQIVFVLDSGNNPIGVAYISTESVANGTLNIGAREMALGLIAFNPYLMILSQDQRANILEQAEWHANFNGLVSNIEAALIQSPENALDYETYPHVYQTAMAIGLEILESYGDNLTASHGSYGILSSVGQENVPHLDDPTGSDVTFVNPKMVFYGVDINPPAGGVDDILLRGKGNLLSVQLGWPPIVPTPPYERDFNLGDGTFTLTFYKGFNISRDDWLYPWTAPGKATYANFLKCVSIVLDVFGLQWYVNLNDTTIYYLLSALDPPTLYFDSTIEEALRTGNWLKLLTAITAYLSDHWDEIAYWVYQEWPGDTTAQALQSAFRVAEGVANAIPIAKILILGVRAANEYIPFGFDLVMAPPILEYNVKQTNGVLSEISSLVPPTAVFIFDPLQPYVGETVNFDASDSYDDADPQYSLQVRWDFDGDGSWDTSWTTSKTESYAFEDRGTYRTVLEVKDTNGQIGHTSHDIYVGSTEELVIVLTWGANPRDLDSHLWTPEIEGSTYHVCYWQKYHDLTNPPYVMLDLDDTRSYGPETIWFERVYPGTYTYAVHKFAGSGELTTSNATVNVIDRYGVVATFYVPTTGSGRWWTVFEMNGATREITPINTIGGSPTPSSLSFLLLKKKTSK